MWNLGEIKNISILDVAKRLGIEVKRGNKAFCFGGHDKNTLSLKFKSEQNTWKCYGCGKWGDNLELVKEVTGCSFIETLSWFSNEFNIYLPKVKNQHIRFKPFQQHKKKYIIKESKDTKSKSKNIFVQDTELYTWFLNQCKPVLSKLGLQYLESHGISQELASKFFVREIHDPGQLAQKTIKKWGAERVFKGGLAWGKNFKAEKLIWSSYAILFPFIKKGEVIYLQGRLFEKRKSFINLFQIAKPLFNVDRLKSLAPGATIHICEGVPDAIAIEGIGLMAVAVLGATSFRTEWTDLFRYFKVMVIPDGDSGGKTFLKSISNIFRNKSKTVGVVRVPKGEDAASVISRLVQGLK